MDIRLWESNIDKGGDTPTNVLGMKWDRASDVLLCNVKSPEKPVKLTKKRVLSVAAQIFDPLGFPSPVTLIPKMCLQETWISQLSWDEEVGEETARKFEARRDELEFIKLIRIPRLECVGARETDRWSIHTFCDASTKAYAAAVFLRFGGDENGGEQLLMSKSRVAPLRDITINRLELISCEIGAQLCKTVIEAMKLEDVPHYYWSDSSTALSWIKRDDAWGTFVGNRVNKILAWTEAKDWRHVPGALNPADLPSRGCGIRALLESRWWQVPSWLRNKSDWPGFAYETVENDVLKERKKTAVAVTTNVNAGDLPWYSPEKCRFSQFSSLVRVLSFAMRFINKCCKLPIRMDNPDPEELEAAERKLLRMVQEEAIVRADSKLNLKVIEDIDGLVRVQTKITMREDAEAFRFPVQLPARHPVTESIVREAHLRHCHAGTQFLMSRLREKYWILKGRKTVDRVVTKCVRCRRFRSKHAEPEAAPLPLNRVRDAHPFEITGVDYMGPLFLNDGSKAWVALYTCAVVRAVHLEVVSGLSTEVFLLSFHRFVARCGRPSVVYADNGTNFVGASRLLSKLDWNKIERESTLDKITFRHNVPSAPWWGGFFERMVRSVKELLVRVLGARVVNQEELSTVLLESVINARPLTYLFENDDVVPLTPSMFVRGVRVSGVPDVGHLDSTAFQRRFRYRERLMADLRQRFRKEYLGMLVQKRSKARDISVRVGDVVLIGSEGRKRLQWPVGQVLEDIAGRDGIPRVAKLKTTHGTLVRPLQRLYPLEVNREEIPDIDSANSGSAVSNTAENGSVPMRTRAGREVKKPARLSYDKA